LNTDLKHGRKRRLPALRVLVQRNQVVGEIACEKSRICLDLGTQRLYLVCTFDGAGPNGDAMSPPKLPSHRPIAFFAQLRTEILRHVASSIIKRSAMEMSAIISDPQKYNLLLNAAAASSSGEIYAITCEEAAKLEMTIRSGQQSYLHSEPVIKNRSSSKALRGLRT